MEKINSLQQLEECLKANLILCTPTNKGLTYITLYKDKVRLQNEYSRYILTFQDFLELYGKQPFFIYEEEQGNEISVEKDEEYYGWYHK